MLRTAGRGSWGTGSSPASDQPLINVTKRGPQWLQMSPQCQLHSIGLWQRNVQENVVNDQDPFILADRRPDRDNSQINL